MGMFDWYEPIPGIPCPMCRRDPDGWQGKDGPNALFVWRQGDRHPIGQRADPEAALEPERYAEFGLPAAFRIYAECPEHGDLEAQGWCDQGVWKRTNLFMA